MTAQAGFNIPCRAIWSCPVICALYFIHGQAGYALNQVGSVGLPDFRSASKLRALFLFLMLSYCSAKSKFIDQNFCLQKPP